MTENDYSAKKITVLKGLEAVRNLPYHNQIIGKIVDCDLRRMVLQRVSQGLKIDRGTLFRVLIEEKIGEKNEE